MKRPGKYHKRILCPVCKGNCETMQHTPGHVDPDHYSMQPCGTCKGVGLVEMIITIRYEAIV